MQSARKGPVSYIYLQILTRFTIKLLNKYISIDFLQKQTNKKKRKQHPLQLMHTNHNPVKEHGWRQTETYWKEGFEPVRSNKLQKPRADFGQDTSCELWEHD